MITVPELDELKKLCARIPGAQPLLKKIESVATPVTCHTCDYNAQGFCRKWEQDIPVTEMKNACDNWLRQEIPF